MNMRAALANCAWLGASLPAWKRFRRGLQQPGETQHQILSSLLETNGTSAYGRGYRFGEIRSYEQFRERVPILDYDTLQPWIFRIMRGEQSVLTREPVTRLLPTSGSTGARKLIPFTAGLQREFNAAIGPWMVDLSRNHAAIPFGPSYWSVSPAIPTSADEDSAVPIGFDDDSSYLGGVRQQLLEATFAVPSSIRLVADMDCFRYLTLLCLLRQPGLRFISVWHPSFLTLLLDAYCVWRDELLEDIERGTCPRAESLPAEVRRAVDAGPQPRRAAELRRADPANPRALWPKLEVVSCWGDGQAALPRADLQRKLQRVSIQSKGLLATEAFVSIPFQGLHPLAVTSHFFEFLEEPGGTVRLAPDLTSGARYSVIVTTAGGLWRYRLGDLVEVDGWLGPTPSLRFLGRGVSVSDLCGEKLTESFVTVAITEACAASLFTPRFAMLAPESNSGGLWNYTLFVEGKPPAGFAGLLESGLRKNPHYALCRDLQQLGALRCSDITRDAYEAFCRASLSDGGRLGDIKPRHLSPRVDWSSHFREWRATKGQLSGGS